jgi:hypothetical protein
MPESVSRLPRLTCAEEGSAELGRRTEDRPALRERPAGDELQVALAAPARRTHDFQASPRISASNSSLRSGHLTWRK